MAKGEKALGLGMSEPSEEMIELAGRIADLMKKNDREPGLRW